MKQDRVLSELARMSLGLPLSGDKYGDEAPCALISSALLVDARDEAMARALGAEMERAQSAPTTRDPSHAPGRGSR